MIQDLTLGNPEQNKSFLPRAVFAKALVCQRKADADRWKIDRRGPMISQWQQLAEARTQAEAFRDSPAEYMCPLWVDSPFSARLFGPFTCDKSTIASWLITWQPVGLSPGGPSLTTFIAVFRIYELRILSAKEVNAAWVPNSLRRYLVLSDNDMSST